MAQPGATEFTIRRFLPEDMGLYKAIRLESLQLEAGEHRGKGLSRLLYEARLSWAAQRPQLKRLRIGHRETNHSSMAANQRYGFKFVWRESLSWPDGSMDDVLYYELTL